MRLDVSEWLGRHVFVSGDYEPATSSVMAALLKRGDSVVDVGANVGYFTLLAAKYVGSTGQVLSFEPLRKTRESLQMNLRLNAVSNCQVSDVALSNCQEEARFFVGPPSHTGVSSLRPIAQSFEAIRVRTARMDEMLRNDYRVDLIKIDVEGAEWHVLDGMRGVIERWSPNVILEVSPKYLEGMGRATEDLDRLFRVAGYRLYAIEHQGLRPLRSLSSYSSEQFNAFATTQNPLPQKITVFPEHPA